MTPEERLTSPYEATKPWKDLGYANVEESFLYPIDNPPCPVVQAQTMWKAEQQEYVKWIAEVLKIDRKKSKDERAYCPYCDMNNHPRFSCKHFGKHLKEHARHQCTLCMSKHVPFQCARAQVNGGIAKPNWARSSSRSLQSIRIENQIFDGKEIAVHLNLHFSSRSSTSRRASAGSARSPTTSLCSSSHDAWTTSNDALLQLSSVSSLSYSSRRS